MQSSGGLTDAEDLDRARRNADMKRGILYKDVKSELVKENRRA